MSRQIKIIWILSLVSVLLLIWLQGYWLINQYEYVLNTYSEEIALQVLQAGEDEYLLRKEEYFTRKDAMREETMRNMREEIMRKKESFMRDLPTVSVIENNRDSSVFRSYNVIIASVSPENQPGNINLFFPKEQEQTQSIRQHNIIKITDDSIRLELNAFLIDTLQHFNTNLTGQELHIAAERALINQSTPFNQASFDSILVSTLSLPYTIIYRGENDAYDDVKLWKRTGNLLNPHLIINYAYGLLENKGVYVHIKLPVQPVFYRMGIQLLVSAVLTILLIVCLIFQVRIILKQKKVNEIRENFVNTMVHELKRPVQTLKTFVSFLKDKEMRSDAEATEQVVRDSMFELDNLSAYLNKLKDMLQADSETTSLHITGFNLQDLVEKVIRLTHIPSEKEVTITPVYETDDLAIEADRIHFANVLSNLIENAIKYSDDKVNIELKITQDKRKIKVSVKDNGIGIPVTEQEKVFTKFYRGNNIPDKNIPGIGLGLSYVKLIIEAHQGSIHLNSQVGEGTTVTIFLPALNKT